MLLIFETLLTVSVASLMQEKSFLKKSMTDSIGFFLTDGLSDGFSLLLNCSSDILGGFFATTPATVNDWLLGRDAEGIYA